MIVLAAWPAGIASVGVPIALETSLGLPIAMERRAEAVVVPDVVARNEGIGRRLARYEATLGLIAQHRDKLGAIVGLGAQRLVRDNDRGSRQQQVPARWLLPPDAAVGTLEVPETMRRTG